MFEKEDGFGVLICTEALTMSITGHQGVDYQYVTHVFQLLAPIDSETLAQRGGRAGRNGETVADVVVMSPGYPVPGIPTVCQNPFGISRTCGTGQGNGHGHRRRVLARVPACSRALRIPAKMPEFPHPAALRIPAHVRDFLHPAETRNAGILCIVHTQFTRKTQRHG
ncbi:hypothetical protein FRC12_008094 [Ceratobasidium sp. 428]|nr:hypothetical protein FRC12_008094 [Ceratobasidium sp. 428]